MEGSPPQHEGGEEEGRYGPRYSELLEYQSKAAEIASELSGVRKKLNKLRAIAFQRDIQIAELRRQWHERSYLARLEYVQLMSSRALAIEAYENARALRDQLRRSCDLQDMLYDEEYIRDDEVEVIRHDALRRERSNTHRAAVTTADHMMYVIQDIDTKMQSLSSLWAMSAEQGRAEGLELDAAQARIVEEIDRTSLDEQEIMKRLTTLDNEWSAKFPIYHSS
jgi:hypothetical protein